MKQLIQPGQRCLLIRRAIVALVFALMLQACGEADRPENEAADSTEQPAPSTPNGGRPSVEDIDDRPGSDSPTGDEPSDVTNSDQSTSASPRILEIDMAALRAGDLRNNVVIRPGDEIVLPSALNRTVLVSAPWVERVYSMSLEQPRTLLHLVEIVLLTPDPEPPENTALIVRLSRQLPSGEEGVYAVACREPDPDPY